LPALEFAQDRRSELRAGAAEEGVRGDGPAVGLTPPGVDSSVLITAETAGKRFVQLDHVDLLELQTRELQRLRNRECRTIPYIVPRCCDPRKRARLTPARGALGVMTIAAAAPSAHLRAVSGRRRAAGVERGLSFANAFSSDVSRAGLRPFQILSWLFLPLAAWPICAVRGPLSFSLPRARFRLEFSGGIARALLVARE